jgi:hypothetical protein
MSTLPIEFVDAYLASMIEFTKEAIYLADLEERCDEIRSKVLEWDMEYADCCIPSFDVVYDEMEEVVYDSLDWEYDNYLASTLDSLTYEAYCANSLEEELRVYFEILEH